MVIAPPEVCPKISQAFASFCSNANSRKVISGEHVKSILHFCFFHLRSISKLWRTVTLAELDKIIHLCDCMITKMPRYSLPWLQTNSHFSSFIFFIQTLGLFFSFLYDRTVNSQAVGHLSQLLKHTAAHSLQPQTQNLLDVPYRNLKTRGHRVFEIISTNVVSWLWTSA